jgi:hypothetical protein
MDIVPLPWVIAATIFAFALSVICSGFYAAFRGWEGHETEQFRTISWWAHMGIGLALVLYAVGHG